MKADGKPISVGTLVMVVNATENNGRTGTVIGWVTVGDEVAFRGPGEKTSKSEVSGWLIEASGAFFTIFKDEGGSNYTSSAECKIGVLGPRFLIPIGGLGTIPDTEIEENCKAMIKPNLERLARIMLERGAME